MTKVVVIGSVNIDMVFQTNNFPNIGETVIGNSFFQTLGGKGANQAVAASRIINGNVEFIGAVGNDDFGQYARNILENENVDCSGLVSVNDLTGLAAITLANNDNSIIVIPGANFKISEEIIDTNVNRIKSASIVVMQLEIPLSIIEYVVNICNENGVKVILNPAPAQKLSKSLIDKIDYLTPNQHEFSLLFDDVEDEVLRRYPNKLIITKGNDGIVYHDGTDIVKLKSHNVVVKDTTGAGDTFNGILSASIAIGNDVTTSIKMANAGAAMSVTKLGAQGGMPTFDEINSFLNHSN